MTITLHQHEILTKCYEMNPIPDDNQKEIIKKSIGFRYRSNEVDVWFAKCRAMGPGALWAEISLEKKKSEEQKRKKERKEEMAKKKKITHYQHKKLTKFYETNPIPDYDQREIIAESVAMTNVAVDCWFFRCRTVGPDALWTEVGEKAELNEVYEKKENEELKKIIAQQAAELAESKNLIADKDAEIQNLIKNSAKDRTDEIQKLDSWITNLTTMSHNQSDPVRLFTIEKVLTRVSLQLKTFEEAELKKENERLKEQKKELEAMLQTKKKLEEQVQELRLLLKEMNDKIETMTQRNEEQSAELREQVENGKKENEEMNKIIAQQSLELKESKNLLADIQNLTSIQNSVKDAVNAQQEQITKLLNAFEENCSTGLTCWSVEDIPESSSLHPPINVPEDSD
ncbi:hypothetical protein GCK72_015871 [Caenorhabditis remanei]|uniref:Homeobox domain-containing protein n=1 Tax=Caenorhabditis remanei TaxID=31234 RepID=A0A6A5GXT3_CAERE|nr:hypothetical protein GCK72_015871 [Caenorhabditis remanei]KAF1759404.1 hypothetical protein GCK72_015871 [Caenorhabditis remanei]